MKIANLKAVTNVYVSKRGNKYSVVKFNLVDMNEDEKEMFKPVQYGTISYEFIDSNGCLTKALSLGSMWHADTVAEAIENRELEEECRGLSPEEQFEIIKKRYAA